MVIEITEANLADPADVETVVDLIDAYAADPMGRGQPLAAEVRDRLGAGLPAIPGALVLLARLDTRAVGVAVCFSGYSTFEARPLLNLHDLAVLPAARRRGVGDALLRALEERAREAGYCRITLEVRADNHGARALYRRHGYGPDDAGMDFWTRPL